MIIKGNRHSDGGKLARYMMTGKDGERVEFVELKGFASENIFEAFRDVHNMAAAGKAENPFFHVQVRLPEAEQLAREQWQQTADRIQKKLGLTGQARAVVFHADELTGERHMHLAFSLIDTETLTAKPVPFFKLRLKALARELEKEFDITRVKNEREGPIHYAPKKWEDEQARRLGVNIEAVRNTIRACYDRSDCGRGFDDELADKGLILAQGEGRSGYVVIDHAGGLHPLGKKVLGATVNQVRAKLADLERANMPTIEQAREFMLDLPRDITERLNRELAEVQKQLEAEREYARRDPVREDMAWQDAIAKAAIEKEKRERQFVEPEQETRAGQHSEPPPPTTKGPALHIWNAMQRSDSAQAFAAALDEHAIALAEATPQEAQRSHMKASFAKEVLNFAPEYRAGEIVAVTERGQVYQLNRRTTGKTPEEMQAFLAPLDRSQLEGIEAAKESLQHRRNEKIWPTMPPHPEPLKTSARHHFEDAAREANRQQPAPAMPEHLTGRAAHIWIAYNARTWERENQDGTTERITLKSGRDPYQFGLALEDKGLALARVTKQEAERSQAEADHWKKHNEWRPVYREGEFVVITPRGDVYQLNRRTTGHDAKEVQQFLGKADWKALKGVEATKEMMQARAEDRAAERQAKREEITAARMERATHPGKPPIARTVRKGVRSTRETVHDAAAAAKAPTRAIGALFDTGMSAAGILFSLVDAPKSPRIQEQENREGRRSTVRSNAEAEIEIDFSKYSAEHEQEQHNRQQEQAARDRQRELGRER